MFCRCDRQKLKKKISAASERISTDCYKRNAKNKQYRAWRVWFYTVNKEEIQDKEMALHLVKKI